MLLLPAALGAVGFALWIYRRREPAVAGAGLLAALRGAALFLLLLLLWNPSVPAGGLPGGRPDVVLLDVSLSMTAREPEGGDAWTRALEVARARAGAGERVLPFGSAGAAPGIPAEGATGTTSRLVPALERAAELGANRVTLLSDLRLEDGAAAAVTARRLGLDPRVEAVGRPLRNAGVAELELPRSVSRADSLPALVSVFGELPGGAGGTDSITVEVREEDRLVASRRISLPDPGRTARLTLTLPPPAGSGVVVYRARALLDGDGFPDDDERLRTVAVDADEGGLVLLSLRPDFEPRFLLPLLRDVTGLPTRGFLAFTGGRYLSMDAGAVGDPSVDEAAVRRAAAAADLLVLHGVGGGAPAWVREVAATAPRVLVLPRDREGAAAAGITTLAPVPGEWTPTPELPSSPLAPELAGVSLLNLPPLDGLLPAAPGLVGEVALRAQLQGRGAPEPILVLQQEGERRQAVALASGFWRWGFREGAPRDVYRRLWSGVAGWLLGGRAVAGGAGVRVVEAVVPRGAEPEWAGPSLAGMSVRIEAWPLESPDQPAMDTVLVMGEDGRVHTAPLPPGGYGWRATAPGDEAPGEAAGLPAEGRLFVEAWVAELMYAPVELEVEMAGVEVEGEGVEAGRGGRPLRTHPAPFLLLLALLCGEWIGRRRRGLR